MAKNKLEKIDYFLLQKTNPELFKNNNSLFKIILDKKEIKDWSNKKRKELIANNLPLTWAKIGIILDDPYIIVLRDLVKFSNGRMEGYFRIINRAEFKGNKGVAILPIHKKCIVLLKIFRHATRDWHLEIPRGFGEPNMTAKQNALMELSEEINGEINNLIDLGPYHNNTGENASEVKLFLADLSGLGTYECNEGIESYNTYSLSEFEELIRNNIITDGFTIAAYTRAKLRNLLD